MNVKPVLMLSFCLALSLAAPCLLGAQSAASDPAWMAPQVESMLGSSQDLRCLGWSSKGLCALLQTKDAGERGGFYVNFLLLDVVADATLFDDSVHTDEVGVDEVGHAGPRGSAVRHKGCSVFCGSLRFQGRGPFEHGHHPFPTLLRRLAGRHNPRRQTERHGALRRGEGRSGQRREEARHHDCRIALGQG